MTKTALIFGITGQDGSYLAELLLEKGYIVHGVIRRHSTLGGMANIEHIQEKLKLHYGDLTDPICTLQLIHKIQPDELYNLGALSHVKVSFEMPHYTTSVDAIGFLNILEAARTMGKRCKVYQASTSEMYGRNEKVPQNESTELSPCSPYGAAKVFAHHLVDIYRRSYGMFVVSGILFNHESPRRGPTFLPRKVSRYVAQYRAGKATRPLVVGNLNAMRDWGHAKDYVNGMWLMMQQEHPQDFVLATGQMKSVREFIQCAFKSVNVDIQWIGSGIHEVGIDTETRRAVVVVDEKYFRPNEVNILCGDASKAKQILNWKCSYTFEDLVYDMIHNDIQAICSGLDG